MHPYDIIAARWPLNRELGRGDEPEDSVFDQALKVVLAACMPRLWTMVQPSYLLLGFTLFNIFL
jgi:hypothetical protein